MKNLKSIKSFVFNYAQYEIADAAGNKGLLKVNYKDNTYIVDFNSASKSRDVKTEAGLIAQDLLQRKHGVNFANI
jgi:hypothetical protein